MLLTLIYFILILGIIVLVHEFGHFFFSKLFGIHVYEFSIGMGPKLFSRKKGDTEYSIRAIPIGGFCSLAGEDVESDDEAKIPENKRLNNKPVWQRFLVMVFGALNNFILALVVLFSIGMIYGSVNSKAIVTDFAKYIVITEDNKETGLKQGDKVLKVDDTLVDLEKSSELGYYLKSATGKEITIVVERKGSSKELKIDNKVETLDQIKYDVPFTAAEKADIRVGDRIVKVAGHKVHSSEDVSLYLQIYGKDKDVSITIERDNLVSSRDVTLDKEEISGTTVYRLGIISEGEKEHGFIPAVKYTFNKFASIIRQMVITLKGLFQRNLSVKQLSGPVGIYNVVGTQSKQGFGNILYLIALLSINVGFINLLPFPAFDGGRVLFLIIEKIKRSPVSPKVENRIHTIGFILLILLMLYVTFNDILRLF